jgi:hypothetical protein
MTSRKKPGMAFWAAVVVGMAAVLAVTAILTVGMMFGLMHGDSHALEWLAALQRGRRHQDQRQPATILR